MKVNFGEYILPLAVAKRTGPKLGDLERFAGSAFYINNHGTIATCAHIIESLNEDEFLIVKELRTGTFLEVTDIVCHEKFDFAVGQIDVRGNNFFKPAMEELLIGDDVDAVGFTFYGKTEKNVRINTRMLRGYISRISNEPQEMMRGKSTFEVSFPSLSGFSGSPVTTHKGSFLAGMLYNNIESSIEVFSFSETNSDGKKCTEKVHRVIEFGAIHPFYDIQSFLADIGIKAFT